MPATDVWHAADYASDMTDDDVCDENGGPGSSLAHRPLYVLRAATTCPKCGRAQHVHALGCESFVDARDGDDGPLEEFHFRTRSRAGIPCFQGVSKAQASARRVIAAVRHAETPCFQPSQPVNAYPLPTLRGEPARAAIGAAGGQAATFHSRPCQEGGNAVPHEPLPLRRQARRGLGQRRCRGRVLSRHAGRVRGVAAPATSGRGADPGHMLSCPWRWRSSRLRQYLGVVGAGHPVGGPAGREKLPNPLDSSIMPIVI